MDLSHMLLDFLRNWYCGTWLSWSSKQDSNHSVITIITTQISRCGFHLKSNPIVNHGIQTSMWYFFLESQNFKSDLSFGNYGNKKAKLGLDVLGNSNSTEISWVFRKCQNPNYSHKVPVEISGFWKEKNRDTGLYPLIITNTELNKVPSPKAGLVPLGEVT